MSQAVLPASPPSASESLLGPWRLLRRLGAGGMGTVWLAERADGRFERRAAIKIFRTSAVSEIALQGFTEEVRMLGGLDHPGIARLLDVGFTPAGEAWLATEFAAGLPLDEWVAQRRPDLRDRLNLVAELCEAVEFAHGARVVHRDLKPGNIVVTPEGRPKLIDFGLARALGRLDAGIGDRSGLRALTPAYASPEQIEGHPATAAVDVFALGVLLYELLTDRHPFRQPDADDLTVLDAILRAEPAAPSRVGVLPGLRGDLDAIALRALEKDPTRRYRSARDFALDLNRHLAGLPVTARRAGLFYRFGKWLRRRAVVVTAGATVLLAFAAATLVRQFEFARAAESETRAREERERMRQAAMLAVDEIALGLARLPGPTEARLGLLQRAARALAASSPDGPTLAQAQLQLGRAYRNLGRLELAAQHIRAGREVAYRLPERQLLQADLAIMAAEILAAQRQSAASTEAFADARRALATLDLAAQTDPAVARSWLSVEVHLAYHAFRADRREEARADFERLLQHGRRWLGIWPDDAELHRLSGMGAHSFSLLLQQAGESPRADALVEESIAWSRRAAVLSPADPLMRLSSARILRQVALDRDRRGLPGALALLREAWSEKQRLWESDPNNTSYAFEYGLCSNDLGALELRVGEKERSRSVFTAFVEAARRMQSSGNADERVDTAAGGALRSLAAGLLEADHPDRAEPLLDEAEQLLGHSLRRNYALRIARVWLADTFELQARVQARRGVPERAISAGVTALWWRRDEVRTEATPTNELALAQSLRFHGESLALAGQNREAAAQWLEARAMLERLRAAGRLGESSREWQVDYPTLAERLSSLGESAEGLPAAANR